jgi:hypothetical protein
VSSAETKGPPGVASSLRVARPLYWRMGCRVSVIEVKEILRLWLERPLAAGRNEVSGADRKTVRRYADTARSSGLDRDGGVGQLTDELLAMVIVGVRPQRRGR